MIHKLALNCFCIVCAMKHSTLFANKSSSEFVQHGEDFTVESGCLVPNFDDHFISEHISLRAHTRCL